MVYYIIMEYGKWKKCRGDHRPTVSMCQARRNGDPTGPWNCCYASCSFNIMIITCWYVGLRVDYGDHYDGIMLSLIIFPRNGKFSGILCFRQQRSHRRRHFIKQFQKKKLRIDLKWPEMRSIVICGHTKQGRIQDFFPGGVRWDTDTLPHRRRRRLMGR